MASQRLTTEEALAERQRRAQMRATEAERRQHQRDALTRCREQWDQLTFPERYELLRQLLERIVVRDESIQVSLRP